MVSKLRFFKILVLIISGGLLMFAAGVRPAAAICTSPCISVSANPDSATVLTGQSVTSTITVTVSFFDIIPSCTGLALSTNVAPPGPSATLDGYTDCLSSGSSPGGQHVATHTLTVSTSGQAAGTYTVTVTVCTKDDNCHFSNSASFTVNVVDFSLASSPASIVVNVGSSGTSTATVMGINGFSGQVDLSASTSSAVISGSMNPSTVTVDPTTTSATSTLTVSTSAVGTFIVDLMATSGVLAHRATVTVQVVDYSISADPPSVGVQQGSSQQTKISLLPRNGFAGTVTLSASPATGLGASFNTNSITSTTSSILTITAGASTIPGSYAVPVTGISGPLSHSTTVSVNVGAAASFSISASPDSLTLRPGSSGSSQINLASLNQFVNTVSLHATVNPTTGLIATLTQGSVPLGSGGSGSSTLQLSADTAGSYTVTVTGSSGSITKTVDVNVNVEDFLLDVAPKTTNMMSGSSASLTVAISSLSGFAGQVSITQAVSPSGLTCTPLTTSIIGSGTATLTCNGSNSGSFTVTITGATGSLSHSASTTVNVQDFAVALSSASLTTLPNAAATSTLAVTSLTSFRGTVLLSSSVTPAGLTCTLTPTGVTLGASGTSALSCTGSVGNYVVTVTGSSSGLSHPSTIAVSIQDFAISANPTSTVAIANTAATSTIAVSGINGFQGMVALSTSVTPTGLTCTLPTTSVSLGSSGTSALSCTGSAGVYTLTVSGSSNGLTHTTAITVTVQDFTVAVAASSPGAVTVGSSGTLSIAIAASNGFVGTVSLTDTIPTGLTCATITPSSLTGSGTATLSCRSDTAGTYSLTVTAASNPLVHTATTSITFSASEQASPQPSIFQTYLPWLIVSVAIVILALVVIFSRLKGRKRSSP